MGLNIKKIKIEDIKPARYNPRSISDKDFKKLSESIEQFGLVDPIIINLKNHNIIGGHQRFDYLYYEKKDTELHLIELGDIGWVFSDTDLEIKDDNHEKALNLALNRISGEWNYDELNKLLDELAEFDLDKVTGFDYDLDEIDYEFIPLNDEYTNYDIGDDDEILKDDDELIDDEDIHDKSIEENIKEKNTATKTDEIVITITKNNNSEKYITTSQELIKLIKEKSERIR